jgi:AraC-like DNA-binding protein
MDWPLALNGVPPALRAGRVLDTMDVDFARDRISSVLQPHILMRQRSRRRCHLDLLRFNRIGIGAIRFGKMQVRVPVFGDYYLFIACLTGNANLRIGQADVQIGGMRGALLTPGDAMCADFSEECTQLFVRFDSAVLADHAADGHVRFNPTVELGAPAIGPWLRQVALMASDPQTAHYATTIPGLALDYERLLVQLLLAGQPHEEQTERRAALSPRSVKRAEAFLHDRYAESLTMADIARHAGVPIRTLQENFQRFHGLSPGRYLRNVRLDAAHRALRAGLVATATEAAMDAGLFHLGRFSRDYAERFGEPPSETLRTIRRRLAN